VDIAGKSMIRRVVERVQQCSAISHVAVATDDERIFSHVQDFGTAAIMTHPDHPSGTDRCLEAYRKMDVTADCIINVQGDEPFVDFAQLDSLIQLISQPEVSIATLAKKINDLSTLFDPSKVKVVMNARREALYFSRQAIPFYRNEEAANWHMLHTYYKHLGLYAFKPDKLEEICSLTPSSLEKAESLEQLRWLENGNAIHIAITEIESPSIDTPEDLEQLKKFL